MESMCFSTKPMDLKCTTKAISLSRCTNIPLVLKLELFWRNVCTNKGLLPEQFSYAFLLYKLQYQIIYRLQHFTRYDTSFLIEIETRQDSFFNCS